MKIATVLGARPQFIKARSVSAAIAAAGESMSEVLVHTGQHFDANMSDIFFAELGMSRPAYQLGVGGGLHGEMTGRMLIEIERVLMAERPDMVLVYGDTNSTLAGALAAAKLNIPVAHVEAGLRSFNPRMPEEINRVLTDHLSRWLFAPTTAAVGHLAKEGIADARVHLVGDVMYDASLYFAERARARTVRHPALATVAARPFALATVHRAENTDDPARLAVIVDALETLAAEMKVVWPLHPRTRKVLAAAGRSLAQDGGLVVTEPLGYLDMLELERDAELIVTDSGGVQKEAFFFRTPCVTVRDETEWVELVDAGWNRLAPPHSSAGLVEACHAALGSQGRDVHPYGDGDAAAKIVQVLSG